MEDSDDLRMAVSISLVVLELCIKIVLYVLAMIVMNGDSSFNCDIIDQLNNFTIVFILGLFNVAFSAFCLMFCKYPLDGETIGLSHVTFVCLFIMDLVCEVSFFQCFYCFYAWTKAIIMARAVLVIVFVLVQYVNLVISCYTVRKHSYTLLTKHIVYCIVFAVALLSFIVLNSIILTKLRSMPNA